MKLNQARVSLLVVLVGLGLLFGASGAKAGCAVPYAEAIPSASLHGNDSSNQDAGGPNEPVSIVGLWHLIYTASYDYNFPPPEPATPPFTFLESYKIWHGDGTEFENAFLSPVTGNICFGVWKDLGHGNVKLHHIGLMFGPDGSVANVFTVDETDTVAPNGKTYKGYFDFKLFDGSDVYGTGAPIAEVRGTTAGTRISVD